MQPDDWARVFEAMARTCRDITAERQSAEAAHRAEVTAHMAREHFIADYIAATDPEMAARRQRERDKWAKTIAARQQAGEEWDRQHGSGKRES